MEHRHVTKTTENKVACVRKERENEDVLQVDLRITTAIFRLVTILQLLFKSSLFVVVIIILLPIIIIITIRSFLLLRLNKITQIYYCFFIDNIILWYVVFVPAVFFIFPPAH